jgi:hypothetical protein
MRKIFVMAMVAASLMVTASSYSWQRVAVPPPPPKPEWTMDFPMEIGELVPTGRNPYFILEPGYQLILERGKSRLVVTVLDETTTIGGVTTRVVEKRQIEGDALVEVSRNYFAISKLNTSVYCFGKDVDIYKDGNIVSHEGSWRAGENGAHFGLAMPGQILLSAKYYQELAPQTALDRAEIVGMTEVVRTAVREFTNCIKIEESSPLEQANTGYKYYARGVGLVQDGTLKLTRQGKLPKPKTTMPANADGSQ